jgi:outer membrane protein assembly factor BamA
VTTFLSLPLTESRIRFSQLRGTLTLGKIRNGAVGEPITRELNLSPSIGYRFDSRDSHIRPGSGGSFAFDLGATYPLDNHREQYYRARNDVRFFVRTGKKTVLAMLSNVVYQFGDFPDYLLLRLGGSGTLRGQPEARFSGFHRWFHTVEWRYQYIPRKVFNVPFVRQVDVGLAFVTFIDGGIVWDHASQFDADHYHATAGIGFRFYNPIRDVLRLDFGFNLRGDARFHWGTGIRF